MDFKFDCPQTFMDLQVALQGCSLPTSNHYDKWFQTYHPEHDQDYSACLKDVKSTIAADGRDSFEDKIIIQSSSACSSLLSRGSTLKTGSSKNPSQRSVKPAKADAVDESLEKEIRLFNSKRKEALKRTSSAQISTAAASVPSKKAKIQETIEDEIQLLNSTRTTERLPVEIRSFPLIESSNGVEGSGGSKASSRLEKLADFKLCRAAALASESGKENSLTNIKVHPPSKSKASVPVGPKKSIGAKIKGAEIDEVMLLLKKHNEQFRGKSSSGRQAYEPSRHSVRDVRVWERATGKTWSGLATEEREAANAEILAMKEKALPR